MAARHANPGIRLRASALRRCPRGCDKLGHFPGGPDRPGQTTAAFADSEGLGKSHRAGGRACLGPQVGLQTQQRPNWVHERAFILRSAWFRSTTSCIRTASASTAAHPAPPPAAAPPPEVRVTRGRVTAAARPASAVQARPRPERLWARSPALLAAEAASRES